MNEFVSNSSGGVGRINFVSGSCAGGVICVREPRSWRDCVFSSSTVSQVNGCSRLCELYGGISARENIEWNLSFVWFPRFVFRIIGGHGAAGSCVDRYGA